MERPTLSDDAAKFFQAWLFLARERPWQSLSAGMGGVRLPLVIPREAIRREGERRYYAGDDLDDFCAIVEMIDDFFVEVSTKAEAARVSTLANKNRKGRPA